MSNKPFWMVYGMGQGGPTYRHHSLESAKTEATRLARANPGVQFFILETIGTVEKVDVVFTDLRVPADDGIPF